MTGLPPIPLYLQYSAGESQYADRAASASPTTLGAVAHFQARAAALTTPAKLLSDYPSLQVVLGAFGMSGVANQRAVLQALMTQDPTSPTSLARRMANPTYLRFAQFMSKWSPPPFAAPSSVATIVQNYKRNQFEQSAGQQTPGMQAALYFTRTIGGVKSVDGLLSDRTLLPVVLNAVGLPTEQFEALDYTQQSAILAHKVDLKQFGNASWVRSAAEQYLVQQQEQNAGAGGPAPGSLLAAFGDGSASDAGADILSLLSGATATSGGDQGLLSLFA